MNPNESDDDLTKSPLAGVVTLGLLLGLFFTAGNISNKFLIIGMLGAATTYRASKVRQEKFSSLVFFAGDILWTAAALHYLFTAPPEPIFRDDGTDNLVRFILIIAVGWTAWQLVLWNSRCLLFDITPRRISGLILLLAFQFFAGLLLLHASVEVQQVELQKQFEKEYPPASFQLSFHAPAPPPTPAEIQRLNYFGQAETRLRRRKQLIHDCLVTIIPACIMAYLAIFTAASRMQIGLNSTVKGKS